jgi:hypothetical protein
MNSRWQRDLAFSHVKVGDALRDQGKLDEARKRAIIVAMT